MWPFTRKEDRAQDFTSLVSDAIVNAANGTVATADGLAAVEACSSLIGRCFASAEAVGDATGLVTPGVLEVIGPGNCAAVANRFTSWRPMFPD